ncbi:MAG TPA: hypothetical protein VG870_13690 [Chitinophagaceae bacterium]|nr:hypothetical protein [Chitinophagaceae bacterium]
MSNFISLQQAIDMTTRYRNEMGQIVSPLYAGKDILPICEKFDQQAFASLLGEPGCVAVRIYLGMDPDLKIRLIAVGVNDQDQDIIPASAGAGQASTEPYIIEDGIRCPDICPASSPLNT